MSAPLHVVILAAGEGKRMKSALPKVLQTHRRPADAGARHRRGARAAARGHPCRARPWRRPGAGSVRARSPTCVGPSRRSQLGTGHAVQQAMPGVPDDARVLVLYGDVPLVTPATLQRLLDAPAHLVVLAAELADATGYGRIVRNPEGHVEAIVEQKDATEEQRRIHLVNTGMLAADAAPLQALARRAAQRQRAGRVLPHRRLRAGRRRIRAPPTSC